MSATEEVLEEALEVGEEIMTALEESAPLSGKHLAVVGILGAVVGGVATFFVTKKLLTTKYEEMAEQEIAEAKAFYSALNKKDAFSTPEKTVAELMGTSPKVESATEALLRYRGELPDDGEGEALEPVEVEVEETVSIFRTTEPADPNFDLDVEVESRTPDKPYIISEEEFMQGEHQFEQIQLTYYAGDGALADDGDLEIPFPDPIVGNENLERFGHGSGNDAVVFVRNERLSTDFEVLKNDGKYAHVVAGLEHSDGGSRGRRLMKEPRRFRDVD
jgi:hypothetical protein